MLCKTLKHQLSDKKVKYRALSSYKDIAQFIENIPVSTVNRGIALAKSAIVIPSLSMLERRVVGADVDDAVGNGVGDTVGGQWVPYTDTVPEVNARQLLPKFTFTLLLDSYDDSVADENVLVGTIVADPIVK